MWWESNFAENETCMFSSHYMIVHIFEMMVLIYSEAIEEELGGFLNWGLGATCDSCCWSVVFTVWEVLTTKESDDSRVEPVQWFISCLFYWRMSLGFMPKMIKANSICVVRCQADECAPGHVQIAAGKSWVICMPRIFAHQLWLAKKTDIAADIKHGLVPRGSYSNKLTSHYKSKAPIF